MELVLSYKLLGVMVNTTLKWDDDVAAITSKAAKRLWFLKKFKPAGASVEDLILLSGGHPTVLEYALQPYKDRRKHLKMFNAVLSRLSIMTLRMNKACLSLNTAPFADR